MEALLAPRTRQIGVGGLAVGGGDLTVDRTISVPKASAADVAAGTDDAKALTALSVATAFASRQPLSSNLTALSTGTITGVGTGPNTLAAGNDSRIVNALQPSGNLAGLASASTARSNLGLGSIATQAASSIAVTGGAVDGTAIGATTPAAGKFTTILGDGSGVNVAFPSLATRTLLDRLLERPSVIDYGVDMTGSADSTAALTAALNSGKRVSAPCGIIRLVSTVSITVQALFDGPGNCLTLKYDAPAGAAVTPVIDIQKTAAGTRLDNFAVDHQANTKGYAPNTVYGGNIIASSAILVQADDSSLTRVTASNGFDNCIAIVQFTGTGAAWNSGQPRRASVQGARTNYCGVGSSPKAGAGVDVGSGSLTVVNDLVDIGSYGAFILDIGAGAQGSFSNLQGFFNKYDPSGTGNYTFYIGAPGSQFSNLHSFQAGYRGLWVDGYATDTTITNVMIKGPAAEGVILMAPRTSIANLAINSPGLGKTPGTVDAVLINNGTTPLTDINITGLVVSADFNTARYGINKNGTGTVSGSVVGSSFTGAASGAVAPGVDTTFAVLDATALLGPWTTYTPTVTTSSGAFTTVSATGKYRKVGKSVRVSITVTLGDKGSAVDLNASVPFAAKGIAPLHGTESALTGRDMSGLIRNGQSVAVIKNTDGTNPLTNGYVLTVSGEYETP